MTGVRAARSQPQKAARTAFRAPAMPLARSAHRSVGADAMVPFAAPARKVARADEPAVVVTRRSAAHAAKDAVRPALPARDIVFTNASGAPIPIHKTWHLTERKLREEAFEILQEAFAALGEGQLGQLAENELLEMLGNTLESATAAEQTWTFDRRTGQLQCRRDTIDGTLVGTVDAYELTRRVFGSAAAPAPR